MTTPNKLSSALEVGLKTISQNAQITFQSYSREVLPIDGYVFWKLGSTLTVQGSLHYSQDIEQNEDETVGLAHVVFTTNQQVTEFANAPPNTIFVATVGEFRFSFAKQQGRYEQAGLWHYSGRSIYPALATQLDINAIDPSRAIVSNSLPFWLALNSYKPVYGFTPNVTLYPADLVEPNLTPPYGAVVIEGPRPLSAIPSVGANYSSTQLVADRVRIVLYGLQSNEAIDFLNSILQYSRDTLNFGMMSSGVPRDTRRTQTELQAIAMQKTLDMEVSYNQSRANAVARQLILSVTATTYTQSL